MNGLKREIEDIERFEEILHILFDQGFRALLDRLDLLHHIPVAERLRKPGKKTTRPGIPGSSCSLLESPSWF